MSLAHIGVKPKHFSSKIAESLNLIALSCIDWQLLGQVFIAGHVLFNALIIQELKSFLAALAVAVGTGADSKQEKRSLL